MLLFTAIAWPQTVQQKSTGDCSPTIANVNGTITFNCPGIPKKAEKILNGLLNKMYKDLQEKTKAAEEWANRYQDLRTRLAAQGDESVLAKEATKLLQEGDLEGAGTLLDKLIAQQEGEVGRLAESLFNRSQVFSLQFRRGEAIGYLEKAYKLQPTNSQYAHQYALLLYDMERRSDAERVLRIQIERLDALIRKDDDSEYLAKALNNLAGLEADTLRFQEAENHFSASLDLYKKLVIKDPETIEPFLAATLSNLAGIYVRTFRYKQAEENLAQSITLLESRLGEADSETIQISKEKEKTAIHLVIALGNFAALKLGLKDTAGASAFNARALNVLRRLYSINPRVYEQDLLRVISDGIEINSVAGSSEIAAKLRTEGLTIMSVLTANDPGDHKSQVARFFAASCRLLRMQGRFTEAKLSCEQASSIYRVLRATDARLLANEHSGVFLLLAEISVGLQNLVGARWNYEQALELERLMATQAPTAEQPQLARVLHDSGFYDLCSAQFDNAVPRMQEAVSLLRTLGDKFPDMLPLLGESLNGLGVMQTLRGLPDEGGQKLKEALRVEAPLAEKEPNRYGPLLAQIYFNLAACERLNENYTEAEWDYKQSIDIYISLAIQDRALDAQVLNGLFNLIGFYKSQERWNDALESAQQALKVSRALPQEPINIVKLAEQLENLATVEYARGENVSAEQHLREGLHLYHKAAEEESIRTVVVQSLIAMSTGFDDYSTKCKLLAVGRSLVVDPNDARAIDVWISGCRNGLPWPLRNPTVLAFSK